MKFDRAKRAKQATEAPMHHDPQKPVVLMPPIDIGAARRQLLGPHFWLDKYTEPPPAEPPLTERQRLSVEILLEQIKRQTDSIQALKAFVFEIAPAPAVADQAMGKRGRGRPRKGDPSPMPKEVVLATNPADAELRYYLKCPEVVRITGKSKTAIYEGMEAGTFPQNVRIGPRSVAWVRSKVIEWCEDCDRASREGEASA
jgi:prophage regulatory protein